MTAARKKNIVSRTLVGTDITVSNVLEIVAQIPTVNRHPISSFSISTNTFVPAIFQDIQFVSRVVSVALLVHKFGTCIPIATIGGACEFDRQCPQSSYCSSNGFSKICRCLTGYRFHETYQKCFKQSQPQQSDGE